MANEQNTTVTDQQDLTVEALKEKANTIFEKNKTLISVGIGGLIVLVLGLYGYFQLYKKPREIAANLELYKAELEMKRDSLTLALTGRNVKGQANNFIGFVGIIENYSGTQAANLAHYYAGVASLKLSQPKLAMDYLSNFSGEELLQAQAYNLMGDATSELGDFDGAIGYYQKAAGYTENIPLQCYAKYKAAKALEKQGKNADAKKVFQEILDIDLQIGESLGADKDVIRLK